MDGKVAEDATAFAFAYLVENEKRIRAMLLRAAHGDKNFADEMYSDVVLERLPRIIELWDGDRPLENYALNNLRWYAFKWMNRRRAHNELADSHSYADKEADDSDSALSTLDELDQYLIKAYYIHEMPMREIAAALKWPRYVVSYAIKQAREKLAEAYEENRDWVFVKRVIRILTQ